MSDGIDGTVTPNIWDWSQCSEPQNFNGADNKRCLYIYYFALSPFLFLKD